MAAMMTRDDVSALFFLCRARMEKDMDDPSSRVITPGEWGELRLITATAARVYM